VVYGAKVNLIDGLISDCGPSSRRKEKEGWFDISTLKEPFRVGRQETMGYELSKQLVGNTPTRCFIHGRRRRPDRNVEIILELVELGWVRPGNGSHDRSAVLRMRAVGPRFEQGAKVSQMWQNAATFAAVFACPTLRRFHHARNLRESGRRCTGCLR